MKRLSYLTKLSPIEIDYFAYGDSTTLPIKLKLIFLELYLNDLLVVPKGFAIRPKEGFNFEYSTFITPGRNYKTHTPNSYERLFLINYEKNPELRMTIMALIRRVFESINFINPINKAIIKSRNIKEYFHPIKWYTIFFNNTMNDKGLRLKSEIQHEINSVKEQLSKKQDQDFYANLINQIGCNILLFKEINYDILNDVLKLQNSNLEVFKYVKYDLPIYFNNYKALHTHFEYFYEQVMAEIEREKNKDDDVGL